MQSLSACPEWRTSGVNKFWAHSLMKRINFVQRKAITSKSKSSLADFDEKAAKFLMLLLKP